MKLCVLIPAYDHLPEVLTCINSLIACGQYGGKIHVQDDCSPNVFYPAVIPPSIASVGRNEQNLGFAANVNIGALACQQQYDPDILLILNQDVFAVPEHSMGWDLALIAPFQDPTVGVVAPRLLFPNGTIQSVGGEFNNRAEPIHRCFGWSNIDVPECSEPREVEWATGAAIAIRMSLWRELNGFDEGYQRGYFEDVDLSLRVREAGLKVIIQPACTLIHSVGSTGGSPFFRQNAVRFRQQWVDTGKVKPGRLLMPQGFW